MHAGKDVRQQFEELIWSSPTVKRFNRRFVLAHVLKFFQVHPLRLRRARLNLTSPTQYPGCLSHVKLSFTNEEYFRFIGYESAHGVGFARNQILPHVRLETLTAVPTLKHLELQFQVLHPNIVSVEGFRGYAYDPWHNIRPEAETEVSCQKEWLRIFLTLAYSRLRSVEKVTLSGHVKNSTREYWEPKLSGEVHDMTRAREEVLSTAAWEL
ncbi:hypothetical protein J4E83_007226 [Alternaria metachromatica]|uniref:uncharacterized protein n=1 Tax=Alternaria metachromatica TaxID=283354 RepID=UPI0020C4EA3B|nr:uncharacterized protein J4E83_007226 [Alternaria metachromatica]KAI4614572.1 hypothetical protein J4E83_007226 [Alternaria metachromatica]